MPPSSDGPVNNRQSRSKIELIKDFVEENGEVDGSGQRGEGARGRMGEGETKVVS